MSALIAAQAASFTAAGAGKSGNPCERLTPPYIWLRRVISRMTDSVNWVAFFDPVNLDMSGWAAGQHYLPQRGNAKFAEIAETIWLRGLSVFRCLFAAGYE